MGTGTKSYNGAISVGLDGTTTHQTMLEWAKARGLKTGDITTAEVQDATPAVQLAHVADRGCYMPGTDKTKTVTVDGKAQFKGMVNCPKQSLSIEEQIVKTRADVVMGGGRGWFNATQADGKTVYDAAKAAGYQIPETKADLDKITSANQTKPVLGLFASGNFQTRFKATPATADGYSKKAARCQTNDVAPDGSATTWPGTQPTLAEMTKKSIDLLDNSKGFFLQVEGASIDKQDHAANPCGQIGETKDLDEAVKVGMDFAKKHGDTLVIVTADHAHTSQIINAEDINPASPSTIPLAGTYNLLTADDTVETVAYGTAQLGGSQQHTGTQLRVAGYGPGAANVVGLSDQTDLFATVERTLSGVGVDKAPPVAGKPQVCTRAPQVLRDLQAKLAKAKKKHNKSKIATLKGQIAGVKSLAKLC
ncbi:alkaline phosphatase [Nocardioides sp.]|uniref:alkaline phosphatase n=1 Tax=Nocardioides sp. TaxID=35761 RepID=UPI002634C2FA|nr:alkaline phosphatase [Nocardioides sp.]